MANRHYGQIGDIWKHLPLAEILSIERPSQYWESHAGSAQYPLSHSMEREYGIFYFLEHVNESSVLTRSAYFQILEELKQVKKELLIYPGSPFIAMKLLKPYVRNYLFCDIDGHSLGTIRNSALTLGIINADVKCLQADGVTTILEASSCFSKNDANNIFIHVDPCGGDEPFQGLETRSFCRTPMDLFCKLTKKGFKAMFWYGLDSQEHRRFCWDKIKASLKDNQVDSSVTPLWCGEILLSIIKDNSCTINPGVRGCGILCANLDEKSILACFELGKQMEIIYRNALLPDGQIGSLDFITIEL